MPNGQPPPPMMANLPDGFKPYGTRGISVAARLEVTLDMSGLQGRPTVEVWVQSNAAATFIIEASLEGTYWREFDRIILTAAGEESHAYVNTYPYFRVRCEELNDSVTEVLATR